MALRQQTSDRIPPHSIEAEQAVLGCLLLSPQSALDEAELRGVTADTFYDPRNAAVWDATKAVLASGGAVDLVTVAQHLTDVGSIESVGGHAYLNALLDATSSARALPHYAEILLSKAALRRAIRVAHETIDRAYEPADSKTAKEIVDDLQRGLESLAGLSAVKTDTRRGEARHLAEAAIEYAEKLFKGGHDRLTTGLPYLDRMLSMEPGNQIILAARPSVGKSSLALNIAMHLATSGIPAGIVTLEMTSAALALRAIAGEARINTADLRKGSMATEDFARFRTAKDDFASLPITILDCSSRLLSEVRSLLRLLVTRHKARLLVVDYLQLITGERRHDSREQEVSSASAATKASAMELGVPLLMVAQLNRDLEKGTKRRRPRSSDLRESGAIEQNADVIMLLHEPDQRSDSNPDEPHVELIVDKNREGETGIVDLRFMKKFTTFEQA